MQCKKKIENLFFAHENMKKTSPKSSILKQKFRCFRNFSLNAQQPKWQNSRSKMWSIEQLYIELGACLDFLNCQYIREVCVCGVRLLFSEGLA